MSDTSTTGVGVPGTLQGPFVIRGSFLALLMLRDQALGSFLAKGTSAHG